MQRPHYHFTPRANWMNDPNGLVYFQGEYHLFFQYNPDALQPGNIGWGHAVSPDLVHWQELPLAIPHADGVMAFSGSALVDWQNASGFGDGHEPPLIAIYTGHRQAAGLEDQRLAYSTDRGRTWTTYAGNPVLAIGESDFRDPKVFWHAPSGRFVMVVVLASQCKVSFYGSGDLKTWDHLSDFGPAGASASIWEVPDLFELPIEGSFETRWVLKVDVGQDALFGGSGGQYFVGHFDGTRFTPEHSTDTPLWLEFGKDFYAAVSWSDLPEGDLPPKDARRVWLGWMNNWQYAVGFPTEPWRGAMTIPRTLSLRHDSGSWRLVQRPVRELEVLRGEQQHLEQLELTETGLPLAVSEPGFEIILRFEAGSATEFGLELGEHARIGYEVSGQQLFVERHGAWINEHFSGRHGSTVLLRDGILELRVFVDTVSVEVFAEDGATTITDLIAPTGSSFAPRLYAIGGSARLLEMTLWTLERVQL